MRAYNIKVGSVYCIKNSPFRFKALQVLKPRSEGNPLNKIIVKGLYSSTYGKINWDDEHRVRHFAPLEIEREA